MSLIALISAIVFVVLVIQVGFWKAVLGCLLVALFLRIAFYLWVTAGAVREVAPVLIELKREERQRKVESERVQKLAEKAKLAELKKTSRESFHYDK